LAACGVPLPAADADLPGTSLLDLAARPDHERVAFSEYHAVGSPTGAFMLAWGRWKYHYYVDYEPELFDLESDPEETTSLHASPAHQGILAEMAARLRAIVDPERADRNAKDDQNALVATVGGREAALNIGKTGATPVPGSRS